MNVTPSTSVTETEQNERDKEKDKSNKLKLRGTGKSFRQGGFTQGGIQGMTFQINLLMLFIQRGVRKQYQFRVATEVEEADKFDDLVFAYEKNGETIFRFLQAKHKMDTKNNKITKTDLLDVTGGDYSIQKYFISFKKIEENAKFFKAVLFDNAKKGTKHRYQDFVLCTNIDIDHSLEDFFDEIDEEDDLLSFEKKDIKQITPDKAQISKLADAAAKENVLYIDEKYQRWMMEHVFDAVPSSSQNQNLKVKFRESFIEPNEDTKTEKKFLIQIFLNVYIRNSKRKNTTKTISDINNTNEKTITFINNLKAQEYEIVYPHIRRLKLKSNTVLYDELESILQRSDTPILVEKLAHDIATSNVITLTEMYKKNSSWIISNFFSRIKFQNPKTKEYVRIKDEFLNPHEENDYMLYLNKLFFAAYIQTKVKQYKDKHNVDFIDPTNMQEIINIDNIKTILDGDKNTGQFEISNKFFQISQKNQAVVNAGPFLKSLVFAVNQPSENELKDINVKEIGDYMNMVDGDLVADMVQRSILDYVKDVEDNRFLKSDDCLQMFCNIEKKIVSWQHTALTLRHIHRINILDCTFNDQNVTLEEITKFLKGHTEKRILVIYTENITLTEIKIIQILDVAKTDEFWYLDMKILCELINTKMCPIDTFSSFGSNQLIISITDESDVKQNINDVLHKLFDITSSTENKQVIFIVSEHLQNTFKNLLINRNYSLLEDKNNKFTDLCPYSRKKLIEETKVVYKGYSVTLTKLINEQFNALHTSIGGDLLLQIIYRQLLIKGEKDNNTLYDNVKDFFIDRFMERRVKIDIEIMKDDRFITVSSCETLENADGKEILLISDDKTDYHQLKTLYNETVHWVRKQRGQLIWQASSGSITNLKMHLHGKKYKKETEYDPMYDLFTGQIDLEDSGLQKLYTKDMDDFFSTHDFFSFDDHPQNHIYEINTENITNILDNVVILASEPGSGKSTILSYIAAHSSNSGDYCIIRANLRDYYGDIPQAKLHITSHLDAIDFLYQISNLQRQSQQVGKLQSSRAILKGVAKNKMMKPNFEIDSNGHIKIPIEKEFHCAPLCYLKNRLFTHLYNENKIIILLDGFDEVASEYMDNVLCLLKILKETKINKMWITTRPYNILHNNLEETLNTFAFSLVPLTLLESQNLILKYIITKIPEVEYEEFVLFLETFQLQTYHRIIATESKSQTVFLGLPLHVIMLATVLEHYFKNQEDETNYDHSSLFELYTNFFIIKFNELYDKIKIPDPKSKLSELMCRHQMLAVMDLFSESTFKALWSGDNLDDIDVESISENIMELISEIESGADKMGIVTKVENGRPRFVHRTYAEYFISDLLSDILLTYDRNSNKYDAAKETLYNLITDDKPSNCILTFFNYKVASKSDHAKAFNSILNLKHTPYYLQTDMEEIDLNLRDALGRSPLHYMFCQEWITYVINKKEILQSLKQVQILPYDAVDDQFWPVLSKMLSCHTNMLQLDDLFSWSPLHYCMIAHHCKFVKNFLCPLVTPSHEELFSLLDDYGFSPYSLGIKRGCTIECLQLCLLKFPVDINAINNEDKTALLYALETDKRKLIVDLIITCGADVSNPNKEGVTPISIIVSQNDLLFYLFRDLCYARRIFKTGKKVFDKVVTAMKPHKHVFPFLMAQNQSMTDFIITNLDIDINFQDSNGKIALHYAFERIHLDPNIDMLLFLLLNNADVYHLDNNFKLPSHYDYKFVMDVFRKGYSPKTFSYLNEMACKDPNLLRTFIMNMMFDSNIIVQIFSRYQHLSNIILKDNAEYIDIEDDSGKTALHHAVILNRQKNVCHILSRGANPVALDVDQKTPLDYLKTVPISEDNAEALDRRNQILQYLLIAGAYYDVNMEFVESNEEMKSIKMLFSAIELNNFEAILSLLCSARYPQIIVNARRKQDGFCPLHIAASQNRLDIVKLLLSHGAIFHRLDNLNRPPVKFTSDENIKTIFVLTEEMFIFISNYDGNLTEMCKYTGKVIFNAGFQQVDYHYGARLYYPLHLTIHKGNVDLIKFVLESGGQTHFKMMHNITAFQLAQNKQVMELLLKHTDLNHLYEIFIHEDVNGESIFTNLLKADNEMLDIFLNACKFEDEQFDKYKMTEVVKKAVSLSEYKDNIKASNSLKDYIRSYGIEVDHKVLMKKSLDKMIEIDGEDAIENFKVFLQKQIAKLRT